MNKIALDRQLEYRVLNPLHEENLERTRYPYNYAIYSARCKVCEKVSFTSLPPCFSLTLFQEIVNASRLSEVKSEVRVYHVFDVFAVFAVFRGAKMCAHPEQSVQGTHPKQRNKPDIISTRLSLRARSDYIMHKVHTKVFILSGEDICCRA
jgi:hypothetical protein